MFALLPAVPRAAWLSPPPPRWKASGGPSPRWLPPHTVMLCWGAAGLHSAPSCLCPPLQSGPAHRFSRHEDQLSSLRLLNIRALPTPSGLQPPRGTFLRVSWHLHPTFLCHLGLFVGGNNPKVARAVYWVVYWVEWPPLTIHVPLEHQNEPIFGN